MVRKDDYRVRASYKEVPPIFEATDDGEEFLVVNVVVSFCRVEHLGVVSHQLFPSRSFMLLV